MQGYAPCLLYASEMPSAGGGGYAPCLLYASEMPSAVKAVTTIIIMELSLFIQSITKVQSSGDLLSPARLQFLRYYYHAFITCIQSGGGGRST